MKTTRSKVLLSIIYTVIFAIAMAFLESAVVIYLRRIYGITELSKALISFDNQILFIEAGREFATLIMLCMVALLAGKNIQSRLGYFLLLFGFWDIFYYFWLRVFIGWPLGWFETDLLFMLPVPWWGPVLAPMLIAMLMIVTGIRLVVQADRNNQIILRSWEWLVLIGGVGIDLFAFMADALATLPASIDTLSRVRLSHFQWVTFLFGLGMIGFSIRRIFYSSGRENKKNESV